MQKKVLTIVLNKKKKSYYIKWNNIKAKRIVLVKWNMRNFMLFRNKNEKYGKYPCVDLLNNAIRFLQRNGGENANDELAIEEIVYAISKADGRFHEDVKSRLLQKEKWKRYFGE